MRQGESLRRDALGVGHLVFYVVANAAPLTGIVLGLPVIIGIGVGVGAPAAFLLVAVVLGLFAVGYVAMSKHITSVGGLYSYIAQGLGRPFGLGGATLAIFAYNSLQIGLWGGFGVYAGTLMGDHLGIHLPWWLYVFIGIAAVLFFGVRRVDVGAKVLGVLLTIETAIIVILDAAILVRGPSEGSRADLFSLQSLETFSPTALVGGAVGVALLFAHAAFIGFEATAIYSEEAKDPRRTVPRATYIAVASMGVFYAVSAWLIIGSFGGAPAVDAASEDPASFAFVVVGKYLGGFSGDVLNVLILTSIFASVLASHNFVARYLYALGRQRLAWSPLGRTHPKHQSPYMACIAQTVIAVVVVAIFALAGRDPFGELFVWATGLGAAGIILLQATTGVAVVVFFRRHDVDSRVWNTLIAPVLGGIGLVSILYFALSNFSTLTGVTTTIPIVFMNLLLWGSALGGVGWALWMQRFSPDRYSRVGALLSTDLAGARTESDALSENI
jgi:amino acid transporter